MPQNSPWEFFICVLQSTSKKMKENYHPYFIRKDHEMSFSVVPRAQTAQGTDCKHHDVLSKFLLILFLSVVPYYVVPIGDLFHWTTQLLIMHEPFYLYLTPLIMQFLFLFPALIPCVDRGECESPLPTNPFGTWACFGFTRVKFPWKFQLWGLAA